VQGGGDRIHHPYFSKGNICLVVANLLQLLQLLIFTFFDFKVVATFSFEYEIPPPQL
jgi:hypothetical protein